MSFSVASTLTLPSGRVLQAFKTAAPQGARYTYVIAATHGDEVESLCLVHHWFQWLKQKDRLPPIIVIPCLNPDGIANGTRVNANGIDLNRNLPSKNWTTEARSERYFPGTQPLSEPENQFLDALAKQYRPLQMFSFHAWRPFLQYEDSRMASFANTLAAHNHYDIIAGEITDHPTTGSLSAWSLEHFDAPVLTIELPEIQDGLSLKAIISANLPGLKAWLSLPQWSALEL